VTGERGTRPGSVTANGTPALRDSQRRAGLGGVTANGGRGLGGVTAKGAASGRCAPSRWPAAVGRLPDCSSQPCAATRCFASRGDANSVPHTNRMTGPYEAAAGSPVKYSPGTEDR